MLNELKNKRVLVTGVTGQVGRALVQSLSGCSKLVTVARSGADVDLDLADSDKIVAMMESLKPDIVINPAAYTQVDKAEDEPEIAQRINADAPGVLAEQCKKYGSMLIHYSTDYVFPGTGEKPLTETDPVSPINVYGKTKLAGEVAIQAVNCDHLIFRTCWVYDSVGKNFLNTIARLACERSELQIVDDQFGTPTSADFIAQITRQVVEHCIDRSELHRQGGNRLYNLTANGYTSWFGFAERIVNGVKKYKDVMATEIKPVATEKFPTKAKRPNWSVLSTEKLISDFDIHLSSWESLVDECLVHKYCAGLNT